MNQLSKTEPVPRYLLILFIIILITQIYGNKTNKNEMAKLVKDSVETSSKALELSSKMADMISSQKIEIAKLNDKLSKLEKDIGNK